MKTFKLTTVSFIISILFNSNHIMAQDWHWQNPYPTGNKIYCIDFVDDITGWFGSSAGTILHTTDGGNSWNIQYVGIDELFIQSIDFINNFEGWAVGNYQVNQGIAYILHTEDGGTTWSVQYVDSLFFFQHNNLYR